MVEPLKKNSWMCPNECCKYDAYYGYAYENDEGGECLCCGTKMITKEMWWLKQGLNGLQLITKTILKLGEQEGYDIVIPPKYIDIALQTKDIFIFDGYSKRRIGYVENINRIGNDKIEGDVFLDGAVAITKEHIFQCEFLTDEKYMFWFAGKQYIKKIRITGLHLIEKSKATRWKFMW